MLSSLRGKIFLLVVAILLAVAAFVMPVTQRDVTRTVEAGELHAVDNVMDLVMRDTEARWSALLDDKINSVRGGRRQLVQMGTLVDSVLSRYADMADRGVITQGAAKGLARDWINHLKLDDRRHAFIYDAGYSVLASGAAGMTDMDLSGVLDIKGRPLAQALLEETRRTGYSFAIYRWPVAGTPEQAAGRTETRYAYFGYFRPWNWVFAVSDSAQDILDQVQARREQMEAAMRATLSRLTLAQSGFMFIMASDGRMVVAPPEQRAGLLDAVDRASGQPLRALLGQAAPSGKPRLLTLDGNGGPWLIQAVQHKPLGWTLVAAVPESDLSAPATKLINRQALIFAGVLVLALALAWLIATRITLPLDKLTAYARQLPEQDLASPTQAPAHIAALPAEHPDEVGRLAESFLFMQRKLGENVARLMQETSARERIESELNIARDIQMGLLPTPLSDKVRAQVDLYAAMQPAKEVGGDLYDYFTLPDGRLCVAIGDVSGKGVPAALFMAVTRTLIRATAESETDPALLVQRVNNRLSENNPNMMFVTLLVGMIDLETGELSWANAGHLPPVVVNADGGVRELQGRSGPACGIQEDLPYKRLSARLGRGETLIGYTDGVTDATDPDGAQYGDARMLALFPAATRGAATLAQELLDDVHRFANGADPFDDITLIAVRRI
jgi:sigma-B regulation protein RsbU (phosphoserine phosphatase)